jgi:hypothetical protein
MWTDLLAHLLNTKINGYHVAAGICFLIAGLIALVWMIAEWGGVTLGPDPEPPAFPTPRHARPDSDTGVVACIPGATPVAEFVADVDQAANVLRVIEAEVRTDEPGGLLAGLPVWPAVPIAPKAGPVCPTCGGPFGVCQCLTKAECPLTTQEIRVEESTPEYDAAVRRTRTQDLSALMERVKQT